jgi:hypothetical protein
VGDEVALFSAARHSGIPETSAIVMPRAFGFGCAALRQSAGEPALCKGFGIDRARGRRASVSECGGLPPLCCSELKNAQLSTFNGESTGEPMGQTIERHSQ